MGIDQTADPESDVAHRFDRPSSMAVLEIAHHADLSRIGDQMSLPFGSIVALGRDDGALGRPGFAAPLDDPCVSRQQLTVRADPETRAFDVRPGSGARRELLAYDMNARPLGDLGRLPSGSLIAIGDRVLLSLEIRPLAGAAADGDLGLRGDGAATRAVRTCIRAVAATDDTALVRGETGVGKEIAARAIHAASRRSSGPFVAVNCAALPENLLESELFGHVRGAFSGATSASPGMFAAADGGTMFLDEVGELSLAAQAKLLRALEQKSVRPVGSSVEVRVDVRLVAATHRDLAGAVERGTFRADLYARLDGPNVLLPPLRARKVDLPALFLHFLAARRTSDEAVAKLFRPADRRPPALPVSLFLAMFRHDWPRNVRELGQYVAKVAAAARASSALEVPFEDAALADAESPPSLERPTREELERVLAEHHHVAFQAAHALGVPRTTLDRWMRTLGVRRPRDLDQQAVTAALETAGGDVTEAAQRLGISVAGLRRRMAALGMT